jgi:hypothetical protein
VPAKRSVITFATNKLSYAKFALNCAQSILLHNDLPVYIVSDLDVPVPAKYRKMIFIIPAKPEHAALGIGIKLYADEYLQTEHTLFIDSDCICYDKLDQAFEACEGLDVSAAGLFVPAEDWCGAALAKTIKDNWSIDKIIRFNGGFYYFRKSALTTKIFDEAREIAKKYDEYGFVRIKHKWMNEEVPLSIAMTLNGQSPMADDGTYMTDMFTDYRPKELNVLNGSRILENPAPPSPQHRPWYPVAYSPMVLHFGGSNLTSYPYLSQSALLKLKYLGLPAWLCTALVAIFVHPVFRFYYWLKKT